MNLHAVNPGGVGQPEVHAKIALRQIAAATANLVGLGHSTRGKLDPRADREPIAFRSSQFEAYPMTAGDSPVTKNSGSTVDVFNHHVHLAVVEQVANREPTRHSSFHQCGSGLLAGIAESPILLVKLQDAGLLIASAGG